MPTVTGTSIIGKQTIATMPGSTSFILFKCTSVPATNDNQLGTLLLNMVHPIDEYNYDAKSLYREGKIWLNLPTSTTISKKLVVAWRKSGLLWRLDY